jgi:UDP-N-acetylmuramate dehydrogenase
VECFDTELAITRKIKAENCEFDYRRSMFQTCANLIVTAVGFKLSKHFNPVLKHEGLQNLNFTKASDMIKKIRAIRNTKLPSPMDFPNLGSFFKNPILSTEEAETNEKLANLKRFEMPNQKIKFLAGEMLDKLNLKGMKIRNVGLWTQHALVLTSNGITSAKDIKNAEDILKKLVADHYGIQLEREPSYL